MGKNPRILILIVAIIFFALPVMSQEVQAAKDGQQIEDSCPTTLNVAVQFRPEHTLGDQAQSFIDALESVVGPINVTVGVYAPGDIANSETTGKHAFVGLPSAAFHGSALVADTFNSGLPFQFSAQQHRSWLFKHGGVQVEQEVVDSNPNIGANRIVVRPAAMSGPEHGLIFNTDELPNGVLPDDLDAARDLFDGQPMRFFGNGGRLMAGVFNIIQFAVPGQTPYQLMVDQAIIGADFTGAVGDLYTFFEQPGVDIAKTLSSWECDTTPLGDGPDSPCANVAQLGYATFYSEAWHQLYDVQDFYVDADYWNNCLSSRQRRTIERLGEVNMLVGRANEISQTPRALKSIRAYIEAENGNFIKGSWPSAILNELKASALDYFGGLAGNDANFGKVLDSMNDFIEYQPTEK